jgi:hypothetical protein
MNGKGRTILLYCGSVVLILALVLSLATVSQAKQQGDRHGDHQGGQHGGPHGNPHESSKKVKVPEPSTGALLILGSGLTGLAGYCLRRRKRGA